MPTERSTLRIGSRAAATREPRQVRKEAALSAARRVPRIGLVRADRFGGPTDVFGRRRVHGKHPSRSRRGRRSCPRSDRPGRSAALRTRPAPTSAEPRRYRRRPAPAHLSPVPRADASPRCVGQDAVVETLRNAVRLDRLATGCCSSARAARARRRRRASWPRPSTARTCVDGEPDDTCPSCVAIREGRALDVVELDAASNNRVDDMRELLPRVYTAAADLRRKVFIIDEVQRIKEGWDVLLKTLEEPPDGVLFIFCTTDPSQIRPAVVSRLQRFTFRPLPDRRRSRASWRASSRRRDAVAEPDALELIAAARRRRHARRRVDARPGALQRRDAVIDADTVRDLLGLADRGGRRPLRRRSRRRRRARRHRGARPARRRRPRPGRVRGAGRRAPARAARRRRWRRGSGRRPSRALARAARRLDGHRRQPQRPGGYRWQLELALLGAATAAPAAAGRQPAAGARTDPSDRPPAAEPAPSPSAEPPAQPRLRRAADPRLGTDADAAPDAGRPRGRSSRSRRRRALPAPARRRSHPATSAAQRSRRAGRRSSRAIGRNPANKPLIDGCRPVEVRDGVDRPRLPGEPGLPARQGRSKPAALEDGIGARPRPRRSRYAASRPTSSCRLPATADDVDLVAQARRGLRRRSGRRRRDRLTRQPTATDTTSRRIHGLRQPGQDGAADAGRHGPRPGRAPTLTVEGTAGGGAVKAVVTGKQELVSVTIDPGRRRPGRRRDAPGPGHGRGQRRAQRRSRQEAEAKMAASPAACASRACDAVDAAP